jgi:pyruvate dehydrogenase E1 component beta subunit
MADVKRQGRDVTIVAIGRMLQHALAAAELLSGEGIEAEVVDPRTLVPLDTETLLASLRKTNRAVVVDGGVRQYGAGAEIAAMLSEEGFDWLDAPVTRLCAENIPVPVSRSLEPLVQPNEARIAATVRKLVSV